MYWIVTARNPFDDEDTALVLQAETEEEATLMAVDELTPYDHEPSEDEDLVYVLYVIRCGSEEPQIVRTP